MAFNISLTRHTTDHFYKFWKWIISQISYLKKWEDPSFKIAIQNISAGEKQLISAVRACYLKKMIVLFDEISSALDSELELALRKVVLLIQKQSLTFIVAHRLETIREASKIIVMDDGIIAAAGSHQDLLKISPQYNRLIKEMG